jgi:hypothetical protein
VDLCIAKISVNGQPYDCSALLTRACERSPCTLESYRAIPNARGHNVRASSIARHVAQHPAAYEGTGVLRSRAGSREGDERSELERKAAWYEARGRVKRAGA